MLGAPVLYGSGDLRDDLQLLLLDDGQLLLNPLAVVVFGLRSLLLFAGEPLSHVNLKIKIIRKPPPLKEYKNHCTFFLLLAMSPLSMKKTRPLRTAIEPSR